MHAKAKSAGRDVIAANPRNTSRTCPECGHVAAENRPPGEVPLRLMRPPGARGHGGRSARSTGQAGPSRRQTGIARSPLIYEGEESRRAGPPGMALGPRVASAAGPRGGDGVASVTPQGGSIGTVIPDAIGAVLVEVGAGVAPGSGVDTDGGAVGDADDAPAVAAQWLSSLSRGVQPRRSTAPWVAPVISTHRAFKDRSQQSSPPGPSTRTGRSPPPWRRRGDDPRRHAAVGGTAVEAGSMGDAPSRALPHQAEQVGEAVRVGLSAPRATLPTRASPRSTKRP